MSLFPSKSDEVDKKCTGTKIPPRRGYGERNLKKKLIMIPTMPLHVPMLRKMLKSYFEKMTTRANPLHCVCL